MAYDQLFFRIHAVERMLDHDVTEVEVRDVLENGQVIETMQDQFGTIKHLYLGVIDGRPIHVATIDDDDAMRTEIITAYVPDLERWEPGFRSRRSR